ncbi:WD domain-containingprotein [Purpureocillium lavendulum]|uniref:WD domain-containingprotein n=1 Tax=Purpureocillium lavendulum TaxID=1247861 RepID=A0AB34FIN5_9HYPO|nr:WD domain-containingprotein [Purpureocillium lavendulum]
MLPFKLLTSRTAFVPSPSPAGKMRHHASPPLPSSPTAASSSPANPYLSPTRSAQHKERRVPSVTPRRFRRFFTPRSLHPTPGARPALGLMDPAAVNRQLHSPVSLSGDLLSSDPICPSSPTERLGAMDDEEPDKRKRDGQMGPAVKRRRCITFSDTLQPPALLRVDTENLPRYRMPELQQTESEERLPLSERRKATLGVPSLHEKRLLPSQDVVLGNEPPSTLPVPYCPQPVRKLRNRGFEAQLLDREHGFASHAGRQLLTTPACDGRTQTAAFYSDSTDVHHCTPIDGQGNCIPFSLASCHNSAITAIGDEQGYVRLFKSSKTDADEDKLAAAIKAHDNAIMDLDFSADDRRLATACGDRSGRIVDVPTGTVAVELGGGHWDSLRQISFQPGKDNGSVLASSDRAGRVQVWDLRCSPLPAQCFSTSHIFQDRDTALDPFAARTVNTIDNAHERTVQGNTSSASVTAMAWLPEGREHLLLTASEANACIKLWDTRYIKPRRQAEETPLAVTPQPVTHAWRSYGITSLALGADASRLYAVCKDSTVYAYSTAHLILGHAPELLDNAYRRRPAGVEGLGPLYGFKQDMFRVSSFYVKCAVRPARDGRPEVLAVGSSDSCAVLFPTDERYMRSAWSQREHVLRDPYASSAAFGPALTPSQSFTSSASALTPSGPHPSSSPIPVFRGGTPLVRGHGREVTTVAWAARGEGLVSASDDYVVRAWHEDADRARYLRTVGEFGGERHMAGWADVGADWDEDEC